MLDHLGAGDVVVVTRLDRLARSTGDLLDIAERLSTVDDLVALRHRRLRGILQCVEVDAEALLALVGRTMADRPDVGGIVHL